MPRRSRNRLKIAGKQTVPGRDCTDMIDDRLPRSRNFLLLDRSRSNPPLADNVLETNMRREAPRITRRRCCQHPMQPLNRKYAMSSLLDQTPLLRLAERL